MTQRSYHIESRIEQEILERGRHAKDKRELLYIFLDIPDYSPRFCYELAAFRRIFKRGTFERSRDERFDCPDDLAAWIHDTSILNEARSYNGSASFKQLHRILGLKVRRAGLAHFS